MKPAINLDSLLVLDAIARQSSFAAAAEEQNRVTSSVTYAIQKLEDSLGVELFDRRGHRAHLTAAGKTLLHEGRDLLAMADVVERNVKRVATGWESELRIAVSDLIPYEKVLKLCDFFYQVAPNTRLRLSTEVLGGTWDALVSGRADLVIGAPSDTPAGGGYALHPLGDVEFVFAVSPQHPLAEADEPLLNNLMRRYRIVAAADSSRGLPPRSVGLLSGQSVLTVPDLQVKRQAQISGLGIGYLPKHMIVSDIKAGRLIIKETEDSVSTMHKVYYAWRSNNKGRALAWFKEKIGDDASAIDWFTP